MATIDIGKLTFTHKGDYAGGTAYVANDVVYYNGSAYVAKTSTTGNLPTSTAHWNTFTAGSGGIWNSGLSIGSAGQVVKVNSGASALEFGDASTGGKATLIKATSVSGNPVNVDFVHGTGGVVIDSTYDYYIIDIINCASQTDVHMMYMQIMQSGSAYTSGNYMSHGKEWYKANGSTATETLRHNAGINNFPIGQVGASNASGEQNMNVTIRYNPNGTGAEYPNADWKGIWWQDNNQSAFGEWGGHILDTSGVNAFNGFRFGWHSNYGGNVNNTSQWSNQGKVVLYGVKS